MPGHPLDGLLGEVVKIHEDDGESAAVLELKLHEGRGAYKVGDVVDIERYEAKHMAKQTKQTGAAPAETKAPNAAEAAAAKQERMKNDKFTRNYKDGKPVPPNGKIPPQAMVIINAIEAAGKTGLTRAELVKNITGVLLTKQPVGRIVSYYQKLISTESGAVTISAN
jgi:hypothetical protein